MKKIVWLISLCTISFAHVIYAGPAQPASLVSRVNGKEYSAAVPFQPLGVQGTLDATFANGGSSNLSPQMPGGVAARIQTFASGDYITVLGASGANSVLAKYNALGALQTEYGVGGMVDLGADAINPTASMIDSQNRMVVGGGGQSSPAWIKLVSEDGSAITPFVINGTWQYLTALGQQSTGQVIASGANQSNAQLARFTLNGTIDLIFGTLGYVVFDGTAGFPVVTAGVNFVIDAQNNTYVTYPDSNSNVFVVRLTPGGAVDTDWAINGIASVPFLSAATGNVYVALDLNDNLVVTAQVRDGINIAAIASSTGGPASPNFTPTTIAFPAQQLVVRGLTATVDQMQTNVGALCVYGNNSTTNQQIVAKLYSTGGVDAGFNDGAGYLEFSANSHPSSAFLTSLGIAPNGQMYVAGQESNQQNVVSPYVYRCCNNFSQAVSLFPVSNRLGTQDLGFGQTYEIVSKQKLTAAGVVQPFTATNYRANAQQKIQIAVNWLDPTFEASPRSDDLAMGMDGYTDASATTVPMVTWGDATTGLVRDSLVLNSSVPGYDETMADMEQDTVGNLYVASNVPGYGAFATKYSTKSTDGWTAPVNVWKQQIDMSPSMTAVSVTPTILPDTSVYIQPMSVILTTVVNEDGGGSLYYFDAATGLPADGQGGTQAFGTNGSGSVGPHDIAGTTLGQINNLCVGPTGVHYAAYVNPVSLKVDVLALNATGTAPFQPFGVNGVKSNVFPDAGGYGPLNPMSVQSALTVEGSLVVTAVAQTTGQILVAKMSTMTGLPDATFGPNANGISPMCGSGDNSPEVYQVTALSDGTFAGVGKFNGQAAVASLTKKGVLNLDFNPQGTQAGLKYIDKGGDAAITNLVSMAIQPDTGNYVVAGCSADSLEAGAPSSPIALRLQGEPGVTALAKAPLFAQNVGTKSELYGDLGTPGGFDLSSVIGSGICAAVVSYPFGTEFEGWAAVAVDDGTNIKIARINPTTGALDTIFAPTSGGVYTIEGLSGAIGVLIDNSNRLVVSGNDSDKGVWALQIGKDGDAAIPLAMPANLEAILAPCLQQQSARYIFPVKCRDGMYAIAAFQSELREGNDALRIDKTYNPLSERPGSNPITYTPIADMVINGDDTQLVVSTDPVSGNIQIYKMYANGSGLVPEFGQGGIAAVTITPAADALPHIALCADGSFVVAAATSPTTMQAIKLKKDGTPDYNWNGDTGSGTPRTIAGCGNDVVFTDLLAGTDDATFYCGYSTNFVNSSTNGPCFATSLHADGTHNAEWNPASTGSDVPGVLTYTVGNVNKLATVNMAVDGTMMVAGTDSKNKIPFMINLVAASVSIPACLGASPAGMLDRTINTLPNFYDALNLNDQLGFIFGQAASMLPIANTNGALYLTSMHSGTALVTKVDAALNLDRTFNARLTPGYVQVEAVASVDALFVADAPGNSGDVYAAGKTLGEPIWVNAWDATGLPVAVCTAENSMTQVCDMFVTPSCVFVAGKNLDGGGALCAFTPDLAEVNTAFGDRGYYRPDSASPVAAVTCDTQLRVYFTFEQEGLLQVQRLTAAGQPDFTFNRRFIQPCDDAASIKIVLDPVGGYLWLASRFQGAVYMNRFNAEDGTLAGNLQIVVPDTNLALTQLVCDTNGDAYVVGNNIAGLREAMVARIVPEDSITLALDTNYAAGAATSGIFYDRVSPLSDPFNNSVPFADACLLPDGRMYALGSTMEDGGTCYLARLFGPEHYSRQIDPSIPTNQPGEFDYTYGANGTGSQLTFAGPAPYAPIAHQKVKSLLYLNGTKLMTLMSNDQQSATLRLSQDGTNDPSYGSGYGVPIAQRSGNETAQAMILSGNGEYFVIGSNGSNGAGYLKKITAKGAMDPLFGGNTDTAFSAASPVGTVYGLMSDPRAVVELSTGNIAVAGNNAGVGTVQMVGPTGVISNTFGDSGQLTLGTTITSMSADAANNLYVAAGLQNGEIQDVTMYKFDQNGAPVVSFGINGSASHLLTGIAADSDISCAIDAWGNILIAAVSAVPGVMSVTRLLSNGAVDPYFNSGQQLNIVLPTTLTTRVNIANIVPLQDSKLLIAASQTDPQNPDNNFEFVVCLTPNGVLDQSFNNAQDYGSVRGISAFQIASQEQEVVCQTHHLGVQANGHIILAVSQSSDIKQNTPITVRLIGYSYDQAIRQYPGDVPGVPSVLNPTFNYRGIAPTPQIDNLMVGGSTVIDSLGNVNVAGINFDNQFVVSRFLSDGQVDTTFGVGGIALSSPVTGLTIGGNITVDPSNNVYVGGVTTQNELTIAQFDASGNLDWMAVPEYAPNLVDGGYVRYYPEYSGVPNVILIGGATSDHNLYFSPYNSVDLWGGDSSLAFVPGLVAGGHVVMDATESVYVSGRTSGALVVVKYLPGSAYIDTNYGTSGVVTIPVPNLVDGGAIELDTLGRIVIAGCTSDQTFVVARLLADGTLDQTLNQTGIAYSQPISSLLGVQNVALGTLNSIVIGGYAKDYSGLNSMVVAVFTSLGSINTQFSATATGGTGDIVELSSGGFVAVDSVGNIFTGGLIAGDNLRFIGGNRRLVVAKIYSGYEIFVNSPAGLLPSDMKSFYYGNNPDYVKRVLNILPYSSVISDGAVRQDVLNRVYAVIEDYIATYTGVVGYNLTWDLYFNLPHLESLATVLVEEHVSCADEINEFFGKLIARINQLRLVQ